MKAKTCSACGKTQPVVAFGRNRQSLDGLHYYCKACAAARQRQWAKANPEKVREMRAAYLTRVREMNDGRDPYAAA